MVQSWLAAPLRVRTRSREGEVIVVVVVVVVVVFAVVVVAVVVLVVVVVVVVVIVVVVVVDVIVVGYRYFICNQLWSFSRIVFSHAEKNISVLKQSTTLPTKEQAHNPQ